MKKFFAVVLGLALVLGLASVASAEFTTEGKLVMTWVNDPDNAFGDTSYSELHPDTYITLKLSNTWDNASASMTIKNFALDGYEFAYAFSDQFTFKAAKGFEVKTPIFETAGNIDVATDGDVAFIGEFTFDGGWVKAATNLDLDDDALAFAFGAEYAFDPVTIGGVYDSDWNGTSDIGVYVKYALSDEVTLTADVAMAEPTPGTETQLLGLKAEYNGDPFTAAVRVDYNLEDSDADLYWKLEGSYAITDATKLSANFDQQEDYEIKLAHTINEGPVLSFAYNQDSIMTAKIEASF